MENLKRKLLSTMLTLKHNLKVTFFVCANSTVYLYDSHSFLPTALESRHSSLPLSTLHFTLNMQPMHATRSNALKTKTIYHITLPDCMIFWLYAHGQAQSSSQPRTGSAISGGPEMKRYKPIYDIGTLEYSSSQNVKSFNHNTAGNQSGKQITRFVNCNLQKRPI